MGKKSRKPAPAVAPAAAAKEEEQRCPICLNTLPAEHEDCVYSACCSSHMCDACWTECKKRNMDDTCELCRAPTVMTTQEYFKYVEGHVARGDREAFFQLGGIFMEGSHGSVQSSKKAAKYYELAGAKGHAGAACNLAQMFERGDGVKLSKKKANDWYRVGATKGSSQAAFNLACNLEVGDGIVKDLPEALRLYRSAAKAGSPHAQLALGFMYKTGNEIIVKDFSEAVKMFTLASKKGEVKAIFNLACCHERGEGVPVNHKEAIRLYELAKAQGHERSHHNLGIMHLRGLGGLTRDPARAKELFEQAAGMGVPEATQALDTLNLLF